jgi:hypothetical protein
MHSKRWPGMFLNSLVRDTSLINCRFTLNLNDRGEKISSLSPPPPTPLITVREEAEDEVSLTMVTTMTSLNISPRQLSLRVVEPGTRAPRDMLGPMMDDSADRTRVGQDLGVIAFKASDH